MNHVQIGNHYLNPKKIIRMQYKKSHFPKGYDLRIDYAEAHMESFSIALSTMLFRVLYPKQKINYVKKELSRVLNSNSKINFESNDQEITQYYMKYRELLKRRENRE